MQLHTVIQPHKETVNAAYHVDSVDLVDAENNCYDAGVKDCFDFRTCPCSQMSLVNFGNSRFTGATNLCCFRCSSLNSPINTVFLLQLPWQVLSQERGQREKEGMGGRGRALNTHRKKEVKS